MAAERAALGMDLDERLQFESVLAEVSSRFVNLPPPEVDREIENAQRRVCELLGFDASALWQRSGDDPRSYLLTHVYRAQEGPPVPETMDARDYFPWCLGQIEKGRVVCVTRVEEAPAEAARDLEVWNHYGVRSVLGIPLSTGGGPNVGALSFGAMEKECCWPDDIVRRVQLVAQVFANALVHKRSELLLSESEERLRVAAECGEIGMWILDIDSERFWASDRARGLFGYPADTEITMARFLESVDEEWRARVNEAVQTSVEHESEINIEYRVVLPDGQRRWIFSRGRFQPASGEKPRRLIGASVDLTEHKQVHEDLQRSFNEVKKLREQLEIENAYLHQEYSLAHGTGRVVGESKAILEVLKQVEQVAPTMTTVLVEGETGTGKELISQRVHELSPRRARPLVKVNCAALPSTLVESELFGREKGAYTGAVSREPGRFEVADGSTIFLDEVAELPLELQAKLLRVLEERKFERVGSSRTLTTDVRVIAATNRDLRTEVDERRFRSDLYYRLAVFPIKVPPLRERRGDIPLLVWEMVRQLSAATNSSVENIHRQVMDRLTRYDWPGNVRELRNIIERALILCNGPTLHIQIPSASSPENGAVPTMEEVQRRHLIKVLESTGGRIRGEGGAAELLAMKPTTLRSRMQRLGVDPRRLRDEPAP